MTDAITHLEKTIAGEVQPVTHLEKTIAGEVEPVTHLEKVIAEYSGGGSATLIEKTITANGEYSAVDDEADGYSSVSVDVANSYTASDEGKVVSSGELVAQTNYGTVTENGTYNTTTNNSITVDVASNAGAVYYNTFNVTASQQSRFGLGIVGNKGETGTIFVTVSGGIDIVSPYNTVDINNFQLSDFLSSNKTFGIGGAEPSSSMSLAVKVVIDITNNTITFERSIGSGYSTDAYAKWSGFSLNVIL